MILIQFPSVGLHSYASLFMVVIATGGVFNCILIIIELRVSPMQVGAIMLVINTIATASAVLVPYITMLP